MSAFRSQSQSVSVEVDVTRSQTRLAVYNRPHMRGEETVVLTQLRGARIYETDPYSLKLSLNSPFVWMGQDRRAGSLAFLNKVFDTHKTLQTEYEEYLADLTVLEPAHPGTGQRSGARGTTSSGL